MSWWAIDVRKDRPDHAHSDLVRRVGVGCSTTLLVGSGHGDRLRDTPKGCIQGRVAEPKRQGFSLAAVSYDAVPILADFAKRRAITFPLLSDPGSATIKRYDGT
jgi:hypothetical protein